MKKELLVRQMATPNVTTKKNPDTQRTGYGPKAAKTDSDAKGRAREASARSGRATKMDSYTEGRVRRSKALARSGQATKTDNNAKSCTR